MGKNKNKLEEMRTLVEQSIGERIAEIAEHKGTLQPNNSSYVTLVNILALGVAGSILRRVLEVIVEEREE